jgi:hypothetical protein
MGLVVVRKSSWRFYRKRETFAYSCEAYACVIERGKRPVERRALAQQYARTARISDERVDGGEIAGIVQAAAEARNGWKLILTDKREKITASLEIANFTNKVALYNFLSTFSGTHFLQPRTFVARLGFSF